MANIGNNWSFLQLLDNSSKIVIPIIQRDYAQGRTASYINKVSQKKDKHKDDFIALCEEVREGFVGNLKKTLVNGEKLVLDYIYGAKENGMFNPIDGQQRLTTLFLLYWYIAVKENKLDDSVKDQLSKFTYEIRDTSHEFFHELVLHIHPKDVASIPEGELSNYIRNCRGYYSTYNADPTVLSMLVMLDTLHSAFRDVQEPLWDRLQNISFWVLDLDNFGLTDDLFVKMNARGKRLSRFDVFKSDLEAVLKQVANEKGKADVDGVAKTWITEIDNTYLDAFWKSYGKEYAERNMFRLCIFLTNCFYLINNTQEKYNEDWERNDKEMSYKDQIRQIAHDEHILTILCNAMETLAEWQNKDDWVESLLINPNALDKANEWEYHSRARVFGKIYWFARLDRTDKRRYSDYDSFERILKNYLYSFREYNIKTGQFASRIDKVSIPQILSFIKTVIDDFMSQNSDFKTFILNSSYAELEFEREKLKYSNFAVIKELEEKNYLGRNIQNIFFDGIVHISPDDLDEIVNDQDLCNLVLRIIFSYAKERYGQNTELLFDNITKQTPSKYVYCDGNWRRAYRHMIYIADDASGWGNKVLSSHKKNASQIVDLSDAVIGFARDYYCSTKTTVRDKLESILTSKISALTFDNKGSIIDYLVKYPEFYQAHGVRVLLRRRWDNVAGYLGDAYDLYCVNEWLDTSKNYYQPFYKAIENKLVKLKAVGYKQYDNVIDVSAAYELSNGWEIQIQNNGDFKVWFNGKTPNFKMVSKYGITDDEYLIVVTPGEDCIEIVSDFLNDA